MPWWLVAALLACGDKDGDDTGAPGDGGADGGATDGGTSGTPVVGELQGDWLVGFSVAPVGNIVLPFQAIIDDRIEGEVRTLRSVGLRATDGAEELSEILAEVTDVPVQADGTFVVEFPTFTLPGEFSPTSGEVDVQPTLTVTASSAEGFCGELGGQIVTFEIDLAGSTFGAAPWADRAEGIPTSCSAGGPTELERLTVDQCPAITEGSNTGFPGGGGDRSFELVLPSIYDAGQDWPVVFAFHGIGGTAGGLLGVGLREMADEAGAILVVPQAAELGGSVIWDAVSDEASNTDVLLFDDLLTCVGASFSVDADRVYATGMSNGGLMTGKLLALRGDVLAAAAPLSGGVLGTWPDAPAPPPSLIVWGGESDVAYEQDFDAYAQAMLAELEGRGTWTVACDHGLGHSLEADFWPWVFTFLADHPRVLAEDPYALGLPDTYPDYCLVP
jgi:dienelactone hydrolase